MQQTRRRTTENQSLDVLQVAFESVLILTMTTLIGYVQENLPTVSARKPRCPQLRVCLALQPSKRFVSFRFLT